MTFNKIATTYKINGMNNLKIEYQNATEKIIIYKYDGSQYEKVYCITIDDYDDNICCKNLSMDEIKAFNDLVLLFKNEIIYKIEPNNKISKAPYRTKRLQNLIVERRLKYEEVDLWLSK